MDDGFCSSTQGIPVECQTKKVSCFIPRSALSSNPLILFDWENWKARDIAQRRGREKNLRSPTVGYTRLYFAWQKTSKDIGN